MVATVSANRLGRTALMLHAMGLAAGLAIETLLAVPKFTQDSDFKDVAPILAVGGGASFVLIVWSCVMSLLALKGGERVKWPVAILAMAFYEAIALSVFHNQIWPNIPVIGSSLPVLLPAFAGIATPVMIYAWRRVTLAERKSTTAGGAAWSRVRCVQYGLRWFIPVTIPLFMAAVPVPLFLYSVSQLESRRNFTSHLWVIESTPEFVADASADLVVYTDLPNARELYQAVLDTGRTRRERLMGELQSPNYTEMDARAFWILANLDSKAALEYAEKVANKHKINISASLCGILGSYMARSGSAKQIREYLNPDRPAAPPNDFMKGLIEQILRRPYGFLPELEQYADGNTAYRNDALVVLAENSERADIERLWLKYLRETDPKRLRETAKAALSIHDEKLRLYIVNKYLEHPDSSVRKTALAELAHECCQNSFAPFDTIQASGTDKVPFTKILEHILDDPERVQRRYAACILAYKFGLSSNFVEAAISNTSSADAPPETMPELSERDAIRKAAHKWLETHKQ